MKIFLSLIFAVTLTLTIIIKVQAFNKVRSKHDAQYNLYYSNAEYQQRRPARASKTNNRFCPFISDNYVIQDDDDIDTDADIMNSFTTISSTNKQSLSNNDDEFLNNTLSSNQCLNNNNNSSTYGLIYIDKKTKRRTYKSKMVAMFSCFNDKQALTSNYNDALLDSSTSGILNSDLNEKSIASESDLTIDFRLAKPAIQLAINEAKQRYPDVKLAVAYRAAPDICTRLQASGHAADEYYKNGATFIVGPGCSEPLESVGRLASYWNIPVCSTGYLPEVLSSTMQPQTLIQLSLSVQSVGEMLLELFKEQKWRHLVILTDDKHPLHASIRDGLLEFFDSIYNLRSTQQHQSMQKAADYLTNGDNNSKQQVKGTSHASNLNNQRLNNYATDTKNQQQQSAQRANNYHYHHQAYTHAYHINVTAKNFASTKATPEIDYAQVVLEAAAHSRIMLILARSSTINSLLVAANAQGMSSKQFVFIAHELFEAQRFEQQNTVVDKQQQRQSGNNAMTNNEVDNFQSATINQQQIDSSQQQTNKAKFSISDQIAITHDKFGYHSPLNAAAAVADIYAPLMTISLRIPITSQFTSFRIQIANMSQTEFDYTIDPTSLRSLYSLSIAALIYDCVLLYASKVQYALKEGIRDKIDGKLLFDLSANSTFRDALTGNLTINNAGQRVIDFTLNDFSPTSLSLEPIAHFSAIERRLTFLPGRAPHWTLRNMSAPPSDPRCQVSDAAYCKYSDDYNNISLIQQAEVSLGIWLAVLIAFCVACTSAFAAWLVFYKFRIESDLLNLWWSIKYEDIIFEDEQLLDGKRSMSSLAISSESFAGCVNAPSGSAGRSSPANQTSAQQAAHSASGDHLRVLQPVCLSGGNSTSSLSVSIGGKESNNNNNSNNNAQAQLSASTVSTPARFQGQDSQQQHQQQTANSSSKSGKLGRQVGKLSQLLPTANTTSGKQQSKGAAGSGGGGSNAGNRRDPSISSQNKNNAKLKLGTVLNSSCASSATYPTKVGLYKANRVAVKHINVRNLTINRKLLIELRQVRDLTHENLIKFIGLCPEDPNVAIVSELCSRGNLQDLLQNTTIRLDWTFRYSIINDIVDGLAHLHSSPILFHGRLKSSNCVIDNRFVVKLTDFGLPTLMQAQEAENSIDESQDDNAAANCRLLLWTAPEHLRTKYPRASGSQRGDIYSLAIIFQEIITRCGPFECEPILVNAHPMHEELYFKQATWQQQQQQQQQQHFVGVNKSNKSQSVNQRSINNSLGQYYGGANFQTTFIQQPPPPPVVVQHKQRLKPEEIVNLVRMGLSPPFRPYFRPDMAASVGLHQSGAATSGSSANEFNVGELIKIVQNCWQESPTARPSIGGVKAQIKRVRRNQFGGTANLMDNLLQRMERYTDNLESLVEQKTAELTEEKKRSEELLYEMLPRFVVDQLKYGHCVTPEAYEAVTVCFSDIKDFTSIAAQSSPIEVVNLLNHLYTEFDDCIAQYDVYKVETIGDSYMVVSGLPIRNGDLHAKEVSDMSLALLDLIRNFKISHLPQVTLQLRIGIHSGPCASGVVGTKMFRYCLFGDTVNTASRMESHGEPMKIHISEETAAILAKFGDEFKVEPRGQVDIKGKGIMSTYWLVGKSPS